MAMTIIKHTPPVTGGVDTHLDQHFTAALDQLLRYPPWPGTTRYAS